VNAKLEPLPQRELVLELIFQIDSARAIPKDKPNAVERIRELIRDHPNGMRSKHVLRNLGDGRQQWLTVEVPGWNAAP
jgi:hypothetical protein